MSDPLVYALIEQKYGKDGANEITTLRQQLTAAQAENEALRARLENYEALKRMHRLDNYPNELSAKAWLLRKQAEAVDVASKLMDEAGNSFDAKFAATDYAQRLRNRANEIEGKND